MKKEFFEIFFYFWFKEKLINFEEIEEIEIIKIFLFIRKNLIK